MCVRGGAYPLSVPAATSPSPFPYNPSGQMQSTDPVSLLHADMNCSHILPSINAEGVRGSGCKNKLKKNSGFQVWGQVWALTWQVETTSSPEHSGSLQSDVVSQHEYLGAECSLSNRAS